MRTGFRYSSTFEHDNPIGMLDGAQAMCYHNNRLAFVKFRQILYDRSFVIRIQRIRSLIQKDKRRVLVHHSRDQDTLSLSLTDPLPILPDFRIVSQRQTFDILGNMGRLGGMTQTVGIDLIVRDRDIAGNRI